jgi:hypothetical protein
MLCLNLNLPTVFLSSQLIKKSVLTKNSLHAKKTQMLESDIVGKDKDSEDEEDTYESDHKGDVDYLFLTPDEIKNARAPEVGMVFSSLEESVRFVNIYAQVKGFAVIKGRNYKNVKITLQCNRSRRTVTKSTGQRKRRRTAIDRTDCQMNVIVYLIDTKWHIVSCSLEHNHEMSSSPSLTKFFLSHRNMNDDEKKLSELLQGIRVKPQSIMTIFRRLRGSSDNVKFGKKKLDNLKQAERIMKKNSDIEYTLKYIEKLQLSKPGFCCKMDVDAQGVVRSIFWTDARSRLDYRIFGEIICFDTTYSTNKYNMPFAPIIGINGHGRTIVFGWALLKNQRTETFKWLFQSLIEIMEGKKAKTNLDRSRCGHEKCNRGCIPGCLAYIDFAFGMF